MTDRSNTTAVSPKAMLANLVLSAGLAAFPSVLPNIAAAQDAPWLGTVPKAECGPGSRQETGIQGAVTLAERFSGASQQAFNCNLELVGQVQGEGASWQMTYYGDCAYYAVANNTDRQQHLGSVVVDVSDPTNPKITGYLDTPTMRDPWESLHVNPIRGLLGGVEAEAGTGKGGGFEVYDVKADCTNPKLLASIEVTGMTAHAGNWSHDGQFFYGTSGGSNSNIVPIIDVRDPESPATVAMWELEDGLRPHDMATNKDGTRLYMPQMGMLNGLASLKDRRNGLIIADVSDFAARKPNPEMRTVSEMYWVDSGISQQTLPVSINGHPYMVFAQEMSYGGIGQAGREASCTNGLPPAGFVKLLDIADDTKPALVANLKLEVHDPDNCGTVLTEDKGTFLYDSHYCNVDNENDARLLACTYFEAGLRVFDIRDPYHPKEVAYYKPPAQGDKFLPGSGHWNRSGGEPMTGDWAASYVRVLKRQDTGDVELWFTSHDNGFQVVRFTNRDIVGEDLLAVHPGDDVM